MSKWDVEFSLALHNRTGKYFIGRAILDDQAESVASVYYWRCPFNQVPVGLAAKLLGRLAMVDVRLQRSGLARIVPRLRTARPILHLDPFSVTLHRLAAKDMVLCHDMGPITHPHLFAPEVSDLYRHAYREIAQAKPKMTFVSQASRRAFAGLYGDWGRASVIYPPIRADLDITDATPPLALPSPSSPFLLTVGSLGLRKNQRATIDAFARSGLAGRGIRYVLCGSSEPGAEDVREAAAATEGVHVLPYVSDAELAWLYGNATGFVLLSQLEGFGMPVAEAIAQGLVPLVSSGSVLEEVAGPAALAANPDDPAQMVSALKQLCDLTDEDRAARRDALLGSIARFTPAAFRYGWTRALSGDVGEAGAN
jgi:glycosyltransferase involved in cell wall biosynthesis